MLGREFFCCRRIANSLLKCCAVIYSVLQSDTLPQTCRQSVLQCVAVCCSVLDYAPMRFSTAAYLRTHRAAMCYNAFSYCRRLATRLLAQERGVGGGVGECTFSRLLHRRKYTGIYIYIHIYIHVCIHYMECTRGRRRQKGTDICGICHLHTHMITYTYKYVHTHIFIYTYMYIHICIYICIYIYICTYIYTYIYIHTYICTFIHMCDMFDHPTAIHTYIYVCDAVFLGMHSTNMYICIRVSTYIQTNQKCSFEIRSCFLAMCANNTCHNYQCHTLE